MAETKKPRKSRKDKGKKRGKRIKNPQFQRGSIDFRTIGTNITSGPNLTRLAGLVSSSRAIVSYQSQADLEKLKSDFEELKKAQDKVKERDLTISQTPSSQSIPPPPQSKPDTQRGQEEVNDPQIQILNEKLQQREAKLRGIRKEEEEAIARATEAVTRAQGAENELRQMSSMVGELEAVGNALEIRNQTLLAERAEVARGMEAMRLEKVYYENKSNYQKIIATTKSVKDAKKYWGEDYNLEGMTKEELNDFRKQLLSEYEVPVRAPERGRGGAYIPVFAQEKPDGMPESVAVEQAQEEPLASLMLPTEVVSRTPLDVPLPMSPRTKALINLEEEGISDIPSSYQRPRSLSSLSPRSPKELPKKIGRVTAIQELGHTAINDVLQQKVEQQLRLKQVSDFQRSMERGQEENLTTIANRQYTDRLERTLEAKETNMRSLVEPIEYVVNQLAETRAENEMLRQRYRPQLSMSESQLIHEIPSALPDENGQPNQEHFNAYIRNQEVGLDLQPPRQYKLTSDVGVGTSPPLPPRGMSEIGIQTTRPKLSMSESQIITNIPSIDRTSYNIDNIMDERASSAAPSRIPTVDEVRAFGLGSSFREKKIEKQRRESIEAQRLIMEQEKGRARANTVDLTTEEFQKITREIEREDLLSNLKQRRASIIGNSAALPSVAETIPPPSGFKEIRQTGELELLEKELMDDDFAGMDLLVTPRAAEIQRDQEDVLFSTYTPFANSFPKEELKRESPHQRIMREREEKRKAKTLSSRISETPNFAIRQISRIAEGLTPPRIKAKIFSVGYETLELPESKYDEKMVQNELRGISL